MPILTKPNEQHIHYNEFNWEQFANDCVCNKYALIVGSEAVLNRDRNHEAEDYSQKLLYDAEGNSQKLLFDLTLYQLAQGSKAVDKDGEYQHFKSMYHDFEELLRESSFDKIKVKEAVLNAVRNSQFEPCFNNEIEPSLMQLLKTRCFRMVLTTSIDPYLEIAMEKVWGKGGFDVVYAANAQQKFKNEPSDEFGVTKPVLCYIFDKVDIGKRDSENRFVLSENDAMEKISSWFENHKTNNFLKHVRKFSLISIGCQFDDWMFRFFWFLLRGKVATEADGQVVVEIKNDEKLKNYLEHEKVKVFPDARSFMNDAISNIKNATDVNLLPRKGEGVFISYAHEDFIFAMLLFKNLHSKGINVWIEEAKIEGGDVYELRINDVIKNCKVFIPILSSQVKDDLLSNSIESRWYYKEWELANKRYKEEKNINGNATFKVIPMAIDDYSCKDSYHQRLSTCITEADIFEPVKESMEQLRTLINF